MCPLCLTPDRVCAAFVKESRLNPRSHPRAMCSARSAYTKRCVPSACQDLFGLLMLFGAGIGLMGYGMCDVVVSTHVHPSTCWLIRVLLMDPRKPGGAPGLLPAN